MRSPWVPTILSLLVLASISGVATQGSPLLDASATGDETPADALLSTGATSVEFSDWSDWSNPPPARAPLVPEPGAPGAYTGPDSDAVPPGWNAWSQTEHNQCGDLKLIFGNHDLDSELRSDENLVTAEGAFFIQFQAIGDGAEDITRFSFSFGKSHEEINNNELLNCNESLPDNPLGAGTAGVYIPFYRSDFDAEDGFFIPIETRNVPDGDYAAAVHAYTGDNIVGYTEVARAWALAEVINCDGTGESYCNDAEFDDDADVIANDNTQPWPWVLPGDGVQTNDVDGLTIEILEPANVNATINGDRIELEQWDPPARDRDVLPMNDPGGEVEGCNGLPPSPLCRHEEYSHGWKWEGDLEIGDVIQVEATDRNGNSVFKSIFWDGTGGVINVDFPQIDFNLDTSPDQTIKAGEELRYSVRVENTGGSEAHVDFWLALDGGERKEKIDDEKIQARWMDMSDDHGHPTHIHLEPGQVKETYVDIITDAQTPNGTYQLDASLTYPALGETVERQRTLNLTVDGVVEPETENETADEVDVEDSPMPAFVVITSVVLFAAAVVHRRRQSR